MLLRAIRHQTTEPWVLLYTERWLKAPVQLPDGTLQERDRGTPLVHQPLPQDEPRQRQPDIRFARDELGWEPKVALREGLRPTIAYFEGLLASAP
jgi:UDP-glucuronate decarboxylase